MTQLTFIDFFAGIGGFRLGLEMNGHKCIGFCENDKFAIKSYKNMYNTEGEWFSNDITKIESKNIPYADLWTFGFPCQDISISGNRTGLIGKRSGLYYKIIDLIKNKKEEDKPKWIIAENVKNLLSINDGWDFAKVLFEMVEAGYDIEWQLFNSRNFGVPQNRERVYIVGHLRTEPPRKILPITRENKSTLKQIIKGHQAERVFSTDGVSCTLISNGGGLGAKTGLYLENVSNTEIPEIKAILTPSRSKNRQNGRRYKNSGEAMFTLTCQDQHGIIIQDNKSIRIRRLTPKECFRLQGFPDKYFEKAKEVNSDSQLYRQAGNAVTVNVIYEIGKILNFSKKQE